MNDVERIAHDYTHPSTGDHAESDLNYVAGLEAHLDEGGAVSSKNVRDLIAMVRWNATGLIEALRSLPVSDGWLPIETAPRDGTRIVVAAYCDYNKIWVFREDYWRQYPLSGDGFGCWPHNRSHWRPLPAPPVE